ncbi:hypothetical protein ACFW17_21935 [Streptomyces sp. NPDC058961]|uniref:hypothetical protein n=1 Tax=Streptomyces sp. NPDC058961 TaxID=3346680 RepID=UPI0036AB270B
MRGTGTGRTNLASEVTASTVASQVLPATFPPVTVRPPVTRVVPLRRDTVYDQESETARMPVEIQFADGTTARTELVLNPSQLYAADVQMERAIRARETARPRQSGAV